jgi:replicative DNA helicase
VSAFEDAEADVLGAIMLGGSYSLDAGHRLCDRVLATGLLPFHFWRESNGRLYALLISMRHHQKPLDPLSVSIELEGLDAPGHVRGRLEALARSVVAFNVVEHRCRIVMAAAAQRASSAA